MKVINPTNNDIVVKFYGITYTVKANSELSNVPKEIASKWKEEIHNFLKIEKDSEKIVIPEAKKETKIVTQEVKKIAEEIEEEEEEMVAENKLK